MKHLILALTFCFGLVGSQAQSNYFPLEAGSELVYAYAPMFNQGDADLRSKTAILKEKKNINGKSYFQSQSLYGSVGDFRVLGISYARKGADGTIYFLSDSKSTEYIMMKPNPKVGDSWTSKSNDGKSATMKVVSTSKSITTPDKSYSDCLIIETEQDGVIMQICFKSDVGMVALFMVVEGKEQLFSYLVE